MKKIFIIVVIILVLSAVLYGLYLTGFPASQRQVKFDERRVSDLQEITRGVRAYYEETGRMPQTLEELEPLDVFISSVTDPGTSEEYEYSTTGAFSFELCAVFETEGESDMRFPGLESWEHGIGRTCFERDVLVKEPVD